MNLLLAVILAIGPPAIQADPFARGVENYAARRYADARADFLRALDAAAPDHRGAALYNLGNCAYRLGRPAEAVWYYRRALLRDPGSKVISFNLGLAEEQLGLDFGDDLAPALRAGIERVPAAVWTVAAAVLQTLGLVLALRSKGRRRLRLVASVALLLGVSAAMVGAGATWPAGYEGVVLEQDLPVRAAPHDDVVESFTLGAGERVRVLEWSDRWIHIEHDAGRGWARRARVGVVD